MASSRKNRALYIDEEALSALGLLKAGLLYPVTSLMNEVQSREVSQSGLVNGISFPFPFILSPSGKTNEKILTTAQSGEILDLVSDSVKVGDICVDEIFSIDPQERLLHMYGTDNTKHPGVATNTKRIGKYAICGDFNLKHNDLLLEKEKVLKAQEAIQAKKSTAIMMALNPLHRGHERLIRQTLERTDLLVIFLLKPYHNADLSYDLREKALTYFIDNFLPKNRVLIVPLESSYIFGGYNEIILDAIVAKNYGCDVLKIGHNHAGANIYYNRNLDNTLIAQMKGINIDIVMSSQYVYCDECTTIVSSQTCPHGKHHHTTYASDSILQLLKLGVLPPAILMRKEISAIVLCSLFPNRFENIEKIYHDLMPHGGLLEHHTERDLYIELIKLHQTTSLT
ncbi:MAG: sulfate adenylyltransferase [Campylobacterota bacterium]|nr:sulfate adenylyltransferase [Campylobacterota bacterium]